MTAPAPAAQRAARVYAYENDRPEVRALVPAGARRVLDLGCSSGALGAALKAGGAGEVIGVESDHALAIDAQRRLDRVIEGDLETAAVFDGLGFFDVVIAADVLEHLREPEQVLDRAVAHLGPGGVVVVSLPNVRHWETFWQVAVKGTFPRRSVGIFDRTHLRWFTLRDAYALMEGAGLHVVVVRRVLRPRPTGPSDGRIVRVLGRLPGRTFLTFQHVLVGRVAAER